VAREVIGAGKREPALATIALRRDQPNKFFCDAERRPAPGGGRCRRDSRIPFHPLL